MSPAKKVGLTLNVGAIIAIIFGVFTLHLRFQTAALADRDRAVTQESRDSGQDGKIETTARDLEVQSTIHRNDIYQINELIREQGKDAQRRHEEIIDRITRARGE